MIIDGKKTAAELREELKKKIAELKSTFNAVPGLTVILVGEDPASKIYVKNKEKFAKEVGMNSEVIRYAADLEENKLLNKIKELNKNGFEASKIHLPNHYHPVFKKSIKFRLNNLRKFYSMLVHIPCGWWVKKSDRRKIVNIINSIK